MRSYLLQTTIYCFRLIQLRRVSTRSIEGRDRYLIKVISYMKICEGVALQSDLFYYV